MAHAAPLLLPLLLVLIPLCTCRRVARTVEPFAFSSTSNVSSPYYMAPVGDVSAPLSLTGKRAESAMLEQLRTCVRGAAERLRRTHSALAYETAQVLAGLEPLGPPAGSEEAQTTRAELFGPRRGWTAADAASWGGIRATRELYSGKIPARLALAYVHAICTCVYAQVSVCAQCGAARRAPSVLEAVLTLGKSLWLHGWHGVRLRPTVIVVGAHA